MNFEGRAEFTDGRDVVDCAWCDGDHVAVVRVAKVENDVNTLFLCEKCAEELESEP